ncbi:hypothetical protein LTR37_011022 [Vermiconidia calcicola]|uniref:Uncharacterized protein n=1 Tax=Vermiconidia calcicola TaxID=1690605 RepID=A0ACC3N523_9PEZI|nr:hypothetical protein LTR37_011022 [Vermiconidia calcicola]
MDKMDWATKFESYAETADGNEGTLPSDTTEIGCDREKLEADILAIAAEEDVQTALQKLLLSTPAEGDSQFCKKQLELKRQFLRGVQAILDASGDRRLETSHDMVSRLREEESALDVVEWFFTEAEHQRKEADDAQVELLASIFGEGDGRQQGA